MEKKPQKVFLWVKKKELKREVREWPDGFELTRLYSNSNNYFLQPQWTEKL